MFFRSSERITGKCRHGPGWEPAPEIVVLFLSFLSSHQGAESFHHQDRRSNIAILVASEWTLTKVSRAWGIDRPRISCCKRPSFSIHPRPESLAQGYSRSISSVNTRRRISWKTSGSLWTARRPGDSCDRVDPIFKGRITLQHVNWSY